MIFEFRIIGLFLLFFLITFHSLKTEKINTKNNFYIILISTYLLEFIYILCCIVSRSIMITKIYYLVFGFILSMFTYYFLLKLVKDEQKNNFFFLEGITIGINILVIIMLFILNSTKSLQNFIIYIGIILTIINFILLILKRKNIKKDEYQSLLGFIFLECIFFIFQLQFEKIEIIQSGIILLTTYLYLALENNFKTEIEQLKLERDYANKNLMDKETFLKKLSHEIRIPLNTIDGFSQIMEESKKIEEVKEEAKDIRIATEDLINLVNSMIDLSILETGKLEILKENYNINDTLENLTTMIPSRLKSKDVKFTSKIEKNIPEVLSGDPDRISQMILNVISNSIKYTDKGSINLEVSSVKSNSLCRLIIKITDTGKGMSKEEIQNVLNKNDEEQGIGLKVSYYLAKLMNGDLEIESTEGKGTTITITIDQEIIALKEDKKSKKEKEFKPVSFKNKRVLLVDDNKLNLKVAAKLLLPYDVEITNATSGEECLDILDKDNKFDLILMDDLMPNLSGTETLDILRKIERVSGFYIPVIVLTANATSGMKENYLKKGFDDYLSKPINREELDRILKEYLKK